MSELGNGAPTGFEVICQEISSLWDISFKGFWPLNIQADRQPESL